MSNLKEIFKTIAEEQDMEEMHLMIEDGKQHLKKKKNEKISFNDDFHRNMIHAWKTNKEPLKRIESCYPVKLINSKETKEIKAYIDSVKNIDVNYEWSCNDDVTEKIDISADVQNISENKDRKSYSYRSKSYQNEYDKKKENSFYKGCNPNKDLNYLKEGIDIFTRLVSQKEIDKNCAILSKSFENNAQTILENLKGYVTEEEYFSIIKDFENFQSNLECIIGYIKNPNQKSGKLDFTTHGLDYLSKVENFRPILDAIDKLSPSDLKGVLEYLPQVCLEKWIEKDLKLALRYLPHKLSKEQLEDCIVKNPSSVIIFALDRLTPKQLDWCAKQEPLVALKYASDKLSQETLEWCKEEKYQISEIASFFSNSTMEELDKIKNKFEEIRNFTSLQDDLLEKLKIENEELNNLNDIEWIVLKYLFLESFRKGFFYYPTSLIDQLYKDSAAFLDNLDYREILNIKKVVNTYKQNEHRKCSQNAFYFINKYVNLSDHKDSTELFDEQKKILSNLDLCKVNFIKHARGTGVTRLLAAYTAWQLIFKDTNYNIMYHNESTHFSEEFISNVNSIIVDLPSYIKGKNLTVEKSSNSDYLRVFYTNILDERVKTLFTQQFRDKKLICPEIDYMIYDQANWRYEGRYNSSDIHRRKCVIACDQGQEETIEFIDKMIQEEKDLIEQSFLSVFDNIKKDKDIKHVNTFYKKYIKNNLEENEEKLDIEAYNNKKEKYSKVVEELEKELNIELMHVPFDREEIEVLYQKASDEIWTQVEINKRRESDKLEYHKTDDIINHVIKQLTYSYCLEIVGMSEMKIAENSQEKISKSTFRILRKSAQERRFAKQKMKLIFQNVYKFKNFKMNYDN